LNLFARVALPFVVGTLSLHAQKGTDTVAGVPVAGPVHAHIESWDVPSPNAKPQGIFFAQRNQSAWFSAEGANLLGRFDSKTQKFESFHLRPDTRPYALVEHSGSGVQTTLYFVSRDGGYLGEFDPNTRDVREFRIPGGKMRLQDLIFDHNGVIWFTMEKAEPPQYLQGGKVGRLNLFSSEIRLTAPSESNANPHDLAVDSKGTIYFTELGAARVGSIEPDGMKVTMHSLPNAKVGASGIAITPDDALWLTDSARGYLMRFDVSSGDFQQWPSPSGPKSRPGTIATANGVIWYTETGTSPNMIVRFDPATKVFESWPVDAGGVIGRLSAQPDGTLWFTLPSINKIGELIPDTK
jgi:virginiamycin B lyase